jgi:hypothetical protein
MRNQHVFRASLKIKGLKVSTNGGVGVTLLARPDEAVGCLRRKFYPIKTVVVGRRRRGRGPKSPPRPFSEGTNVRLTKRRAFGFCGTALIDRGLKKVLGAFLVLLFCYDFT